MSKETPAHAKVAEGGSEYSSAGFVFWLLTVSWRKKGGQKRLLVSVGSLAPVHWRQASPFSPWPLFSLSGGHVGAVSD